jgi:hypothetical protein
MLTNGAPEFAPMEVVMIVRIVSLVALAALLIGTTACVRTPTDPSTMPVVMPR